VWALREGGAEVAIWNRTASRAVDLAQEFHVRHAARPEPADLLVNCTSVGLDPSTTSQDALDALQLTGAQPPATVVDLVYRHGSTPLGEWARRRGAAFVDGLEVLVGQGARSLEGWTGHKAPVDTMRMVARDR
jgi:shikimate dehydrogenase